MSVTIDLRNPIRDLRPDLRNIYNNNTEFTCIGSREQLKNALEFLQFSNEEYLTIVRQVSIWGLGMGKYYPLKF